MAKRSTQPDKLSFEDAIGELEALIDQIETGEIGLEESLKRYERGADLIKRCRSVLDGAEKKIAELTPNAEGGLTVQANENQEESGENADDGIRGKPI